MNSRIMAYYNIRDIYSWLVTKITSRHPLSFIVLTLFFIKGWSSREAMLTLLTATMIIEYTIRHISNSYTINQCYKDLNEKISSKRIGNVELIDSKLLQLFADTATKVQMNPFSYLSPPKFLFHKALDYHQFSTYPFNSKMAIIILKKTFDENEPIDRTALAHECGHAFHSQFRSNRFETPVALAILMLLLFYYAIRFNYPSWFLITLLLICAAFPFFNQLYAYKARIENEADDTALKIIETLYGPEEMKSAAKRLTKLKIQRTRRALESGKISPSHFTLIKHLACYLDAKTSEELINSAEEAISSIIPSDDNASGNARIVYERWLIGILQKSQKRETALPYKFRASLPYIICISTVLFGMTFLTYKIFSEPQNYAILENHATSIAMWIIGFAAIINIPATISTFKLWKKIGILANQIGLYLKS